jgi:hypothetical protein
MPSLYPEHFPPHYSHPRQSNFEIAEHETMGKLVRAKVPFKKGALLARFDGFTVGYATQHSLQKSPNLHLEDSHFAGFLAHSCDPNVEVDMEHQYIHALKPIPAGAILTMDYESTEDELFQHFQCRCGSPQCRGLIRGRSVRQGVA